MVKKYLEQNGKGCRGDNNMKKIKEELQHEFNKSIVFNGVNMAYLEKIQSRELLEHKMTVAQRDNLKNGIIMCRANIAEAHTKLELLEELCQKKKN